MSQCKKFAPNIFHKTKCSNCFRQKEEHSAEALECNRASRSIARSGYLFVAPDWDFSVPLNRTKRWQRRWFVLYDDGELNYSVDEHPDTVPQGSIDMSKVLEVTGAEQITGHPHSLALTGPDRVTFVKAASREDARWWAELLAVFPRRHKRNATFPGGRASPSLPQLGRSASPQPPRPRHLSCTGPSPRTNFTTPPLKEERETSATTAKVTSLKKEALRPAWLPEPTNNRPIEISPQRTDYVVTSGSPPTRDKLRQEDKNRARKDWRHERLRDIATALTDHSPESSLTLPAEGILNLKKGWLWYKEKNVESEWLKRWWVLCEQTLNAYLDQDEQSVPEITIELSNIIDISEIATDTRYSFQIQCNGRTYILSAVTSGIRFNWLQALKKAVPVIDSPPIPATPRSSLLSSDEEYRTASEGGRRDSEDWGELPPSPPLSRTMLAKVKERTRLRSKLPRSQSRQSTLDSVSTDELDACKPPEDVEIKNTINKQTVEIDGLRKQLSNTHTEMQYMETELTRFKKLQSESLVREKQAKEMIQSLERSEQDLSQKVRQMEEKYNREQKTLHCRLIETEQVAEKSEEKHLSATRELQVKLKIISNLQQELDSLNERYTKSRQENDRLYKKIQELECKPHRRKRLDSLTDLMDINMDVDLNNLSHTELIEQYLDLRTRFEKAVVEIKAMKRELRESHVNYDQLELETISLRKSLEMAEQEALAQSTLMADRVQDLTVKLATAEKQARSLKLKLQDSREKRRSLSLKGRENFSVSKEIEDKITELESKIFALERNRSRRKHRRERSSERSSPIDDKSLRRLRRKSLDSATTSSSEPIKLFMRLNNLEGKIANVITTSNESLNTTLAMNHSTEYSTKTDEVNNSSTTTTTNDRSLCAENVILAAIEKLSDCKFAFNLLKTNSNSCVEEFSILEDHLSELTCILNSSKISENEFNVIKSSVGNVVKQLENILKEKLMELYERRRKLSESNLLNDKTKIELLAEKIAYENVIMHRIHQALEAPTYSDGSGNNCQRLIYKEGLETINLLYNINGKLYGTLEKEIPAFKTSIEYLTKVLTKRLLSAAQGFNLNKEIRKDHNISALLTYLKEEQTKMNSLLSTYKSNKLPLLADALALKTITLETDQNIFNLKSLERDIVDEMYKVAKENVNSELVESEIHHVMMRTAQLYEEKSSSDQGFFFTFFAYERAALELWSDSVETELHVEMDKNIEELTEMFKQSLSKMQKQNWRRRLDIAEQLNVNIDTLLSELADIISHKSLIDARISVLKSEYITANRAISTNRAAHNINPNKSILVYLQNEHYSSNAEEAGLMDVSQSLEAEFKCMLDHYSIECENSIMMKIDLIEIQNSLQDLALEIFDIVNYCTGRDVENLAEIYSLNDVCERCEQLRKQLSDVKRAMVHLKNSKRSEDDEERRPLYLGTEYLNQVEHLRAAYRKTLTECESRRQQADLEQLQVLCEQVLVAMEHWHRRTLQDLREQHTRELHALQKDKEQALAEETQATLAALDAMRKAHEAEVQREITRFKQDFARRQQDELLELTERLSVKCLEAAALEEQLGSATRQLAHAQQHILQLERNPQLSMQN